MVVKYVATELIILLSGEVENRKNVLRFLLRLRYNNILSKIKYKMRQFEKTNLCSTYFSESRIRQNKLISVDPQYDDDGIGTSDDETNSNTSNAKTCDDDENVAECDDGDDSDDKSKSRRVIKPDMTALNRLLTFDEVKQIFDNVTLISITVLLNIIPQPGSSGEGVEGRQLVNEQWSFVMSSGSIPGLIQILF